MLRPPKRRIGDCPATDAAPSEAAKDAGPEDVVFITGSLFLVAEARAMLVL